MKSIKDFITVNDNGEIVFDEAGYAAEMDRIRNEASTTARANAEKSLTKDIEAKVRKEAEENAKLSAEEKLAKERQALLDERKSFNAERFKSHLKNANLFSDEEVDVYMSLLGDNYDESIAKADKVIAARTKYNTEYEKKFKEQVQLGTPRATGGAGSDSSIDSDAIRQAKRFNAKAAETNVRVDLSTPNTNKIEI